MHNRWQTLCEVPVPECTCAFPVSLCTLCLTRVVHSQLKADVFPACTACRSTGAQEHGSEFSASREHRAARQLGGGWMVSPMASSLRGTRARIQGGWCRRWQTLCEVPVRACRIHGQPMANSLRGTPRQGGWTTDGKRFARYANTSVEKCGFPGSLCTLSVHFVCARCLCTSSMHVVCARCLCTLSVHVVCALWLIPAGRAVIVPLAEETLATWRLPVAIEYQGVLVVRSLLVLVVLTCIAQRVQGRAWCGLDRFACLVACDSVLPNIICQTSSLRQSDNRHHLDA